MANKISSTATIFGSAATIGRLITQALPPPTTVETTSENTNSSTSSTPVVSSNATSRSSTTAGMSPTATSVLDRTTNKNVASTGTTTNIVSVESTTTNPLLGQRVPANNGTTPTPMAGKAAVTAIFANTHAQGSAGLSFSTKTISAPLSLTSAIQRLPIKNAQMLPAFTIQIASIAKSTTQKYSDDHLDVSQTRIVNSRFTPLEENGISSFRPEILQITDFMPAYKASSNDRHVRDYSPAGNLLYTQYNSLWLRRDSLINLLKNLQQASNQSVFAIFENIRTKFRRELDRTDRTLRWLGQYTDQVEIIKNSMDLRSIPRSQFDPMLLPLDDFYDRRMQFSKDKFNVFSDTKIILQLLSDFKSITENYSLNLLELNDVDRINDFNPISIDTTYTLNDGFTFNIEQIRSTNTPINASNNSFFTGFLNSLPSNVDDRVKLLVTLLSKEYRVSRGLGIPQNQKKLQSVFGSSNTGSPFDNIIGTVGNDIFTQPLGPNSLASLFLQPINENASVLTFERKYVDSKDTKKTYIPGSAFYIDSILEVQGTNFNTQPFVNYADQFSNKFNEAKTIIANLFAINDNGTISSEVMINSVLNSFRDSTNGTNDLKKLNKDQAVIAGIFNLANTDTDLKSKLFQYCLLVGLASNNIKDKKPIFQQLAKELVTIRNLEEVVVSKGANPNLLGGVGILRPYIERLAGDIENRIISITTPAPKYNSSLVLKASPDYTRFDLERSSRDITPSAFQRLSLVPLTVNQSTVNLPRYTIRKILTSIVDNKTTSTNTNLIKEFVDLANAFALGAAVNGENVYLLSDQTGRTRFNFLSTSMQLLLLFEAFSSMTAKYAFSRFGRSRSIYNTFITIDAEKSNYVSKAITDITSLKLQLIPIQVTKTAQNLVPLNAMPRLETTRVSNTSTFSKFLSPSFRTIARSGDSTVNTGQAAKIGSSIAQITSLSERNLVQKNIDSPFLAPKTLGKIGPTKIFDLSLNRDTINLKNTLIAIQKKVKDEDTIIANILNIMSVFEQRIRDAKNKSVTFFNQKSLQEFLKENTIEELGLVRNSAQLETSAFIQREIKNRSRTLAAGKNNGPDLNFLVDNEIVLPEVNNALFSLLSEPEYLLGQNADIHTKIVSIGIPAGFSRELSDRVQQIEINKDTFKDKEFDVISIKLYKKDQRFEDLIFKPQNFLFDLSLFQEQDSLLVQTRSDEVFEKIVMRNRLTDLESINNPQYRDIDSIINDEKYNFLNNDEKREIISNHTKSSLWELYIRLLTGMRVEESTFTTNVVAPGTTLSQDFTNLVFAYLRNVLKKSLPTNSIPDLLLDPNVDDETKDILRLITFGNVVFEPLVIRNKVVSPKLFDRIFHFSFNSENFEIDSDKTFETESGKLTMQKSSVKERLVEEGGKLYLKPKDRNELVFEDYFVVIENSI